MHDSATVLPPALGGGSVRILIGFRLVEALRDVLEGVRGYVKQRQLNWNVHCVDSDEFVRILKPSSADGAISVISPASGELISRVRRSGVPIVNMLHDAHPALPSVLSDDAQLGAAAAEYLIGRGFQRFAFAGIDTRWSQSRRGGFERALAAAGYHSSACPTCDRVRDYRFIDTIRATRILQRWAFELPKPIAILAGSDLLGRALLTACENAGVRVPEEAAILGVDNLVATCELAPVPLSSVAQDFQSLGYQAARMLDRLLSGAAAPRRAVHVAPGPVVVRRSTDVLVFEDEYVSAAMRLIHEHAVAGISMKELMRRVPVSRKWLDVRFKALVGHTPSQEIRKLRLARVRDLLLQTDLSIQQIATRCGFSFGENLIRFFRDAYGMPPNAYRTHHAVRRAG